MEHIFGVHSEKQPQPPSECHGNTSLALFCLVVDVKKKKKPLSNKKGKKPTGPRSRNPLAHLSPEVAAPPPS